MNSVLERELNLPILTSILSNRIKRFQNYENAIKNMKSYQKYEQLLKTGELNLFLLNLKNILRIGKSLYF